MSEVITAKVPKANDRVVEGLIELGENLQDAIEKFGAEVVYTNFKASAKITAQALIRRSAEKGDSDEVIQSKLSAWKPGVASERIVDPMASIMSKFSSLPADKQAEIIAKLQAR
jgi:hypothetical protein